jgi:hypothetical protein
MGDEINGVLFFFIFLFAFITSPDFSKREAERKRWRAMMRKCQVVYLLLFNAIVAFYCSVSWCPFFFLLEMASDAIHYFNTMIGANAHNAGRFVGAFVEELRFIIICIFCGIFFL